jgi:hypothetical protein
MREGEREKPREDEWYRILMVLLHWSFSHETLNILKKKYAEHTLNSNIINPLSYRLGVPTLTSRREITIIFPSSNLSTLIT